MAEFVPPSRQAVTIKVQRPAPRLAARFGDALGVPGRLLTDAKFYGFREKILYRMEISNDLHQTLDYPCDETAPIRAAGARLMLHVESRYL